MAEDDGQTENELCLASHAHLYPYSEDFDGRICWILHTHPHSCEWGLKPKWRPWGFRPAEIDGEALRKMSKPATVDLEVIARVIVPSDLREAWRCTCEIDATLPLLYPVREWMGEGLKIKGKLVL